MFYTSLKGSLTQKYWRIFELLNFLFKIFKVFSSHTTDFWGTDQNRNPWYPTIHPLGTSDILKEVALSDLWMNHSFESDLFSESVDKCIQPAFIKLTNLEFSSLSQWFLVVTSSLEGITSEFWSVRRYRIISEDYYILIWTTSWHLNGLFEAQNPFVVILKQQPAEILNIIIFYISL